MSRLIIRVKPMANITAPVLAFSKLHILGISSLTVTYIIAPAAKDRITGSAGVMSEARIMVRTAPIGSTTPEANPIRKDLKRLSPSEASGIDIMLPSGKFCMAIPTDRITAEAAVIPASPARKDARQAPTAIPSGRLWRVTAKNSIDGLWVQLIFGITAPSSGRSLSIKTIRRIPSQNPDRAGRKDKLPRWELRFTAGIIRLQTEAAVITPDAKPRRAPRSLALSLPFIKKTHAAPRVVPSKGSRIHSNTTYIINNTAFSHFIPVYVV